MNILKTIWKDPVWSKVIASGLLVLIGSGYLAITQNWSWVLQDIGALWQILKANLREFIILLLAFFIIRLMLKIRRLKLAGAFAPPKRQKASGQPSKAVQWLQSINGPEAEKYGFLSWFPIRQTLHTEAYSKPGAIRSSSDVSFDGIRVIQTLFEKGVLSKRNVTLTEYVLAIDEECYDYIEVLLMGGANSENLKDKKAYEALKQQMRGVSFISFFPQAKHSAW